VISCAQNFEDVMLWRALKHVKNGFYIDVGAWSPDQDSVTRWFYDSGWRGISIEPNPEFHEQLNERNPEDINLKIALSDQPGKQWINFLSNPGLSTLDDDIAAKHHKDGWGINRQEVEISTLSEVWENNIPSDQDVHFLKVDVEGLEEAVLRGNDWDRNRPWIAVIEATLPMTQVEAHEPWEKILKQADYVFAYADGLNRFYVAKEQEQLKEALKYPPNVFDGFKLVGQQQAEAKAEQADAAAHQYASQLAAVYKSRSWRITAPLRWTIDQVRSLSQHGLKARLKAEAKADQHHRDSL